MSDLCVSPRDANRYEVYELADAVLRGVITAEQSGSLRNLVCNDAEARRQYVRFMHESASLNSWGRDRISAKKATDASEAASPVPVIPAIILDSSPATCSPIYASLTTPGGFLFSYAVSGVLLGIAILICSLIYTSSPVQVARQEPRQPARGFTPDSTQRVEANPVSIGRITGMIDCVWDDTDYAPAHDRVVQGAKFMLKSGLMEITYYTGAKVILHGPCTYETDSKAGGYLSLGKLTARVEIAKPQAAKRNSPFPLPPSPLFAVRTPTATVTDLGTEFGVEVDTRGVTAAHVFEGVVRAEYKNPRGGKPMEQRLTAGEAVRIESDKLPAKIAVDRRTFIEPGEVFARRRAFGGDRNNMKSPPVGLVANWKFDEGRGNVVRESVLGKSSPVIGPAVWVPGLVHDKALRFGEPGNPTWIDTGRDLVGCDPEFRKHFTVSVWVNMPPSATKIHTIVDQQYFLDSTYKGIVGGFYAALRWAINKPHFGVLVGGHWRNMNAANGLPPDQWRHVVFVFDSDRTGHNLTTFIDGQEDAVTKDLGGKCLESSIGDSRVRIGRHRLGRDNFNGAMSDLALWNRAFSVAEIRAVGHLAQDPDVKCGAQQADALLSLFARGLGGQDIVAGKTWTHTRGLAGHSAGDVWSADGKHFIQLDDAGNGLVGQKTASAESRQCMKGGASTSNSGR